MAGGILRVTLGKYLDMMALGFRDLTTRDKMTYQISLLYLSHGLRETACPGVAALHAFCRLYNTLSLRFLTMCTLVPHAHSTLSSAS